ncbi:MAG: Re/Si-specific NAD(P)(+) transhydrogenase subunit alpha [Phycisphaerae bacterium]|nr:Re/Si-specific NAD(P)(+) transhydrogenase subunit alpha [Phycisphaerae bacterium]
MLIGVPKEIHPDERKVAAAPDTVRRLAKIGHEVVIELGAGVAAKFTDAAYLEAGAKVIADTAAIWSEADLVLKVRAPESHPQLQRHEVDLLKDGGALMGFFWPAQNQILLEKLTAKKASVLAMDCVPRISRAQKMDALSSLANIAGYRAVIEAAHHFGRFFTGQMTAAGSIPPAKVLVIGAGVAGLAAIGTATSLGAVVRAFDTRPEVADQVKSLGAEFLDLKVAEEEDGAGEGGYAKVMSEAYIAAEMDLFARQAMEVDVIITTALVPGKPAPKLVTSGMVESMQEGSVIVDMAAAQGGNCVLTEPDQVVHKCGVTLVGLSDLTSGVPTQASQLYATNLFHLIDEMTEDGRFSVDMEDQVVRGALVTHDGQITWPPPKIEQEQRKPAHVDRVVSAEAVETAKGGNQNLILGCGLGGLAVALLFLGRYAPPDFLQHLTVFVLACFVGWKVVWDVTPALHTPLMSVTNAISGIIVLGALIQVAGSSFSGANVLAAVAIFVAMINVTGGFAVTQRMLRMFRKDG